MSIKINIANKHCIVEGTPVIVCGNSGYMITFTFDAEWDLAAKKFARFSYVRDGKRRRKDVELIGDTVAVPPVYKTRELQVGVYAGDLVTSTPARIPCKKSIVCDTCEPDDLDPSQYEQMRNELSKEVYKLCPPLAESGAAVRCEPVEDYPLEVVSHLPAEGVQTLTLHHCGKNILDTGNPKVYHNNATTPVYLFTLTDTGVHIDWVRDEASNWGRFSYCLGTAEELAGKTITVSGKYTSMVANEKNIPYVSICSTNENPCRDNSNINYGNGGYLNTSGSYTQHLGSGSGKNSVTYTVTGNEPGKYIVASYNESYGGAFNVGDWVEWSDIQVEIGDAATAYEPYRGQTHTIDFGKTVNGGTYHWTKGILTEADGNETQLTPQQIRALSGVNTLYTDAGDTTVTGKADPVAVIEKLTNAIIALGGNI